MNKPFFLALVIIAFAAISPVQSASQEVSYRIQKLKSALDKVITKNPKSILIELMLNNVTFQTYRINFKADEPDYGITDMKTLTRINFENFAKAIEEPLLKADMIKINKADDISVNRVSKANETRINALADDQNLVNAKFKMAPKPTLVHSSIPNQRGDSDAVKRLTTGLWLQILQELEEIIKDNREAEKKVRRYKEPQQYHRKPPVFLRVRVPDYRGQVVASQFPRHVAPMVPIQVAPMVPIEVRGRPLVAPTVPVQVAPVLLVRERPTVTQTAPVQATEFQVGAPWFPGQDGGPPKPILMPPLHAGGLPTLLRHIPENAGGNQNSLIPGSPGNEGNPGNSGNLGNPGNLGNLGVYQASLGLLSGIAGLIPGIAGIVQNSLIQGSPGNEGNSSISGNPGNPGNSVNSGVYQAPVVGVVHQGK